MKQFPQIIENLGATFIF